jgi:hypothetical protein
MVNRTEAAYVHWIERYIRHHGIRHPNTLDQADHLPHAAAQLRDPSPVSGTMATVGRDLSFEYHKSPSEYDKSRRVLVTAGLWRRPAALLHFPP